MPSAAFRRLLGDEFVYGDDGDKPAEHPVDSTADGLDVEDSVQQAFLEDDGLGGAELMAAVAADAGFGVEFLSSGGERCDGRRLDGAAVLATQAFDAFSLYDKRARDDLRTEPFEGGLRKRKNAHDVGGGVDKLKIWNLQLLDGRAADINVRKACHAKIRPPRRHENRNILWLQADDGGGDGIDGRQIRPRDDGSDFARRAAVGARAFHADDGIDDCQGGFGRAVDIDNQIRQPVAVLEAEMELRFRHAWNEAVLILKCAGESHL